MVAAAFFSGLLRVSHLVQIQWWFPVGCYITLTAAHPVAVLQASCGTPVSCRLSLLTHICIWRLTAVEADQQLPLQNAVNSQKHPLVRP